MEGKKRSEVSKDNGVYESDGLMLLNFNQMARYFIENTCDNMSGNEYEFSKIDIRNVCVLSSYELSKAILDELYDTIISYIEDDDKIKLI